ncbi:MAG: NAD-dependent succinate-semialdehyde dehydrogenase [Gemmatimonadaceae bacterium]
MSIATINPATGETLRTFDPLTGDELEARLAAAARAAVQWRSTSMIERLGVVRRAGELLDARQDEYGRLMALEMGKPLTAGRAEAAKCAAACAYYAAHAPAILTPEVVEGDGEWMGEVRFQPLGVVLAIMPWNFPFWQVIRFAAPAIAAGNVGLLKHASNVPQCALALETLFRDAGAPEGVFQALLVGSERVEALLDDPRVAAATLTGSEPAGRSVGAAAGRNIKKTVLELGGSDPFVVLPSANIADAAATAVRARVVNAGQSCIAAKRFIVHQDVYDAFTAEFVAGMAALRVGDPLDESTDVGPLATPRIAEELERQVRDSVAAGARVLTGGGRLDRPGNYFAPTVLADVPEGAPAFHEELFGPVATLLRARDTDHAIALANATTFGLGASAWTTDDAEAERCATELEAGSVFVNAMVASDPRYPFGGIKNSGYGRELSAYGLREFVNVKTVRRRR